MKNMALNSPIITTTVVPDIVGPWKFKWVNDHDHAPFMGALSPDLAYLFTKLDDSSFSRSRDMIGPPKFKMSHVALTGPFRGWFVIESIGWHLLRSTMYQIWSLYLYSLGRYERRCKMWKLGWFGVLAGHSRSLELARFDRVRIFWAAVAGGPIRISQTSSTSEKL